jgi:hypothetical protein
MNNVYDDGDTRTTRRSKRVRDVRNERITSSPLSSAVSSLSSQISGFIRLDRLPVSLRERKRRDSYVVSSNTIASNRISWRNNRSLIWTEFALAPTVPRQFHSLGWSTVGGGWLQGKVGTHHRNSRKTSRTQLSNRISAALL